MERSRRRAQRLVHTFIECRMARRVWTHIFFVAVLQWERGRARVPVSCSLLGEKAELLGDAKSRLSLETGVISALFRLGADTSDHCRRCTQIRKRSREAVTARLSRSSQILHHVELSRCSRSCTS